MDVLDLSLNRVNYSNLEEYFVMENWARKTLV